MKYIYLSNTFSKDVFPDNKPNKFTNYLNEELVLNEQWTVNLHEMCYGSQTWHNIGSSNNKIYIRLSNILIDVKDPYGPSYIISQTTYNGPIKILECEIPIAEYLNGDDLMQQVLNVINLKIYEYLLEI